MGGAGCARCSWPVQPPSALGLAAAGRRGTGTKLNIGWCDVRRGGLCRLQEASRRGSPALLPLLLPSFEILGYSQLGGGGGMGGSRPLAPGTSHHPGSACHQLPCDGDVSTLFHPLFWAFCCRSRPQDMTCSLCPSQIWSPCSGAHGLACGKLSQPRVSSQGKEC